MISLFRDFTKTLAFKVIMGLLLLSFAVFGLQNVMNPVYDNTVIKVGARQVSTKEFRDVFDRNKRGMEQQNGGQAVSNEDAVKAGLDDQILEALADQESLQLALTQAGLMPSPKLIVAQIEKIPDVFNPVTQKLDEASFNAFLANQHLTKERLDRILGDDIRQNHFESALQAGYRTPKILTAVIGAYSTQQRDIALIALGPDSVGRPPAPSDAELQAFYTQVKPRLKLPERRQFTIVRFSPADFEAKVTVDDATIQKMYEARKASYFKPDARTFIEITTVDNRGARAIAEALKAGRDPSQVAKVNKGEVISYTQKPKVAVADPAVGDAAFALKEGEISEPIKTAAGFGVIKMGPITPGSVTPFAAVRDQLLTEARHRSAVEKINQLSNSFDDERKSGADALSIAKKLGLPVQPFPIMTVEGKAQLPDGRMADLGQNPAMAKVIKTAFNLPSGGESEVEELGNGEYYAVHIDQVKPSEIPPFAAVKGDLAQLYMVQKLGTALQTKATEITKGLEKGQSATALASVNHAKMLSLQGLDRQNAVNKLMASFQNQQLASAVAERSFGLKPHESFVLPLGPGSYLVGQITNVHAAPVSTVAAQLPLIRSGSSRNFAQDLGTIAPHAARLMLKPKIFPQTARKELGVNAAPADKDGGKKDLAGQ